MQEHSSRLALSVALKSYPHTIKLKSGEVSDPSLDLSFPEIEPIHGAFKPMAREQAFDVSELAIVTYLQAKAFNKPLVLLPVVVAARFQQGCLIHNAARGALGVGDLAGKKIGVRSYSQTTGMWVRAILAQTYDVPLDSIEWITFDDAHLAEYEDPGIARHAGVGKKLLPMLRAGEIDAAILGNDLPDEAGLEPVIPDAAAADAAWYARHHYVPINHMVVMRRDVVAQHPEALAKIYALLKRGKESVGNEVKLGDRQNDIPGSVSQIGNAANPIDKIPFGVNALRQPLEEIIDYCTQQHLLPRKITVDEIFAESLDILGDAAL